MFPPPTTSLQRPRRPQRTSGLPSVLHFPYSRVPVLPLLTRPTSRSCRRGYGRPRPRPRCLRTCSHHKLPVVGCPHHGCTRLPLQRRLRSSESGLYSLSRPCPPAISGRASPNFLLSISKASARPSPLAGSLRSSSALGRRPTAMSNSTIQDSSRCLSICTRVCAYVSSQNSLHF